jgi:hypothetical protein
MTSLPVGRDIAGVRNLEIEENLNQLELLVQQHAEPNDTNEMPQSHRQFIIEPSSASLLIRNNGSMETSTTLESMMSRELQSIRETIGVQQQIDTNLPVTEPTNTLRTANPVIPTISITERPSDNVPLNEFTENDIVMLDSFPEEFLLGCGIPGHATLQRDFIDHLCRQHDGKFARNKMLGILNAFQKCKDKLRLKS